MTFTLKESVFLFFVLILLGFGSWFYIHFGQVPRSRSELDKSLPAQLATHVLFKVYTATGQPYRMLKAEKWLDYPHAQMTHLSQSEILLYPKLSDPDANPLKDS